MNKKKILVIVILICVAYGVFDFCISLRDTSNHEVNSLYESDERIYHEFLGEDDQAMYDYILDRSIKHKNRSVIDMDRFHCVDYEDCGDIIHYASEAIYVDHPELMNYAGYSWSYSHGKFVLRLHPAYHSLLKDYTGAWQINKMLSKIEKETKDMNDKEKIIYVYDWIGNHSTYDHYFTYTAKNQSAYNVFIKKNAVCAGFAKASQIIFSRIGIESYIVNGESEDYHMWNIVKYEDKYYYFDSTIAVGYKKTSAHYYEGLLQEYMNSYHPFYPEWYPEVSSENMFSIEY